MRRAVAVALSAIVVGAIVAGAVAWLVLQPSSDPAPRRSAHTPADAVVTASPAPITSSASPRRSCDTVSHAFAPQRINVAGVTRSAGVVTPPREADGVPGAPPLTSEGKTVFAWDRVQGILPGDPAGNVLLNAHTWPDGSALGNRLLAGLHRGDRIVVLGADARLCYRVTERVEVLASRGLARYYATTGPPQLAIVVCSGRRLGPGVWEKRTIWFASPSA